MSIVLPKDVAYAIESIRASIDSEQNPKLFLTNWEAMKAAGFANERKVLMEYAESHLITYAKALVEGYTPELSPEDQIQFLYKVYKERYHHFVRIDDFKARQMYHGKYTAVEEVMKILKIDIPEVVG